MKKVPLWPFFRKACSGRAFSVFLLFWFDICSQNRKTPVCVPFFSACFFVVVKAPSSVWSVIAVATMPPPFRAPPASLPQKLSPEKYNSPSCPEARRPGVRRPWGHGEPAKELRPISDHEADLSGYRAEAQGFDDLPMWPQRNRASPQHKQHNFGRLGTTSSTREIHDHTEIRAFRF